MIVRLAILMFLQYAVMGAWVPLFTVLLQERGFTPQEVAWCSATSALGALVAPLLWGQIADRWLEAQRCISLCAAASGACLLALADLHDPGAVFLMCLLQWFFMYPVVGLGTALTFRHLQDPQKHFGAVRLWGTVGWVVVGWLLGLWFHLGPYLSVLAQEYGFGFPEQADTLRLGGLLALLLALYALTLPRTPVSQSRADASAPVSRWRRMFEAPLLAARLTRQRPMAVLFVCMFGIYITVPFYSQLSPLLLRSVGVEDRWLPIALTLAQSLEILTLATLPLILLRLGEKGTLFIGLLAWALTMSAMALGEPAGLVVGSLGLNGVFICCFIISGQMYINRKAPTDIRASAQGFLQFINGVGLLIGHTLVGQLRVRLGDELPAVFLIAAVLAAAMMLLFVAGFGDAPERTVGEKA